MLEKAKTVDTLGIEPSTPRRQQLKMLSGCDNQLHHVPMRSVKKQSTHISTNYARSLPSVFGGSHKYSISKSAKCSFTLMSDPEHHILARASGPNISPDPLLILIGKYAERPTRSSYAQVRSLSAGQPQMRL